MLIMIVLAVPVRDEIALITARRPALFAASRCDSTTSGAVAIERVGLDAAATAIDGRGGDGRSAAGSSPMPAPASAAHAATSGTS